MARLALLHSCFFSYSIRAFATPNAAASRTVKESRYCKRLCSKRSQLHQQPSIRERPHADEAFTWMNTSVGALLNEPVRSLGKADLRNAHRVWRPACNGQEEEFEQAHCRANVEGGNKSHGNDGRNNRQHTHNRSRFPRPTSAGNGRCSVALPVSSLPKRLSIPRQCRGRGGCSPGCAVVRLQAPKRIQGAGTDIDLAVSNRD